MNEPNPVEADKLRDDMMFALESLATDYIPNRVNKYCLHLEQENASLKSKLMEAELQRDNSALLLKESMRKLQVVGSIFRRQIEYGVRGSVYAMAKEGIQKISTPLDGLAGKKEDGKR